MGIVDGHEIPNATTEYCECCGCGEQTCCCDWLYPTDKIYWSAEHSLKYEIIDKQCLASTPCSSAGEFDAKTGCMSPGSFGPDSDYCIDALEWASPNSPRINGSTGQCANVNLRLILRCAADPGGTTAESTLNNCDGARWVLQMQYSNSACDSNSDNKERYDTFFYINQVGTFDYCGTEYGPTTCEEDTGSSCPNKGTLEIYFLVDSPRQNPSFPGGCNCCAQGDEMVIKITFDQTACPTAKTAVGNAAGC